MRNIVAIMMLLWYDGMGRLVESTVKQGTSEVAVKPVFPPLEPLKAGALLLPADHSEAFTYDLNANVLTIERKGRDDAGRYRVVDDVEMEYVGNRLSVLRDAAADALLEGSMDMPEGVYSGYDIRYDAAGRLTRDVSRGIANINYSVTGMPWVVGTMSGDCAEFGYTSAGTKLSETIYNGNRTTRREYVGPCEYVDGKLVRVNVPQGYIDSLGVLHAYIRDIQGNVAGMYAAKAGKKSLEQLNDYYAYGGLTADSRGQDRNRYKHTGKELVTDLGLNSYDFTARWQYPMAGAFSSPDAKASDYKWLSPYAFCGGDPINYVDQTGNDYTLIIDDENKTMTVSAVYFACRPDMESLEKAISFWNGQSEKHMVGGYTLLFELEAREVESYDTTAPTQSGKDNKKLDASKGKAGDYNKNLKNKNGNSYTVHSENGKGKAGGTNKNEINIYKNNEQETTGAHEIGHSLGITHDYKGLMTESGVDFRRSATLTEKNVVDIVRNAFYRETGSNVGVGHKVVVNKTIERLYLFEYTKIK